MDVVIIFLASGCLFAGIGIVTHEIGAAICFGFAMLLALLVVTMSRK